MRGTESVIACEGKSHNRVSRKNKFCSDFVSKKFFSRETTACVKGLKSRHIISSIYTTHNVDWVRQTEPSHVCRPIRHKQLWTNTRSTARLSCVSMCKAPWNIEPRYYSRQLCTGFLDIDVCRYCLFMEQRRSRIVSKFYFINHNHSTNPLLYLCT